MIDLLESPHMRVNILTGEKILVSPHRSKRPWQGQVEEVNNEKKNEYEPECYLCPGNKRVDGSQNPDYQDNFSFVNDFSALLKDSSTEKFNEDDLLISEGLKGICKVLAFTPRHDLTLATMPKEDIVTVVELWQKEFEELRKTDWIKYIQIFENKGSIMGCSNPHPHGQIWAQSSVPVEVEKESVQQKKYFEKHGKTLLSAYLDLEIQKDERIIHQNDSFVVLVPFWAAWPYEAMIVSKRPVQYITEFTEQENKDLADALSVLTVKYDNLFNTSFPYSAGIHQAPVNSGDFPEWHWHMHFYPPLLRSATVKKFMVGYEMMANPQRDITAELAAQQLKELSTQHYSF
ncbi:UDP-glucose--hexose-1-phosphate uridylyltransferase [Elizabethkingia sp. JS20170427COW]|uniref:UDP-glucose--hexose-1-phosphate uridylyltransferase n=1 Tax=Elizabethkingia sp. JS20170427COW TaxID=2583851 RepID=UPI001110A7C7|nr:UDP-glucose--hexose-1-phosphate uridylyltransferase [Elizabethkingia sp. JS20170427COW]QCX53725.1 UDP-glucose--hexose-1-phosphate uridylyltransferase [Elizabethkingia sp. JS20170427COW]